MKARRLAVALAAAAVIVIGSPYVGQVRGAVRTAFPTQYRFIIGAAIAVALTAAIVAAVRRIRDRRAFRYGAILAALAFAAAYVAAFRTGNPDIDLVEAFHFVEYGLITWLFTRVWRDRGDASVLILPALATLAVGTLDEWMQWFVPARAGEIRDVVLNAAAIACGLLFSVGVEGPRGPLATLPRRSRWQVGAAVAASAWLVGVFFVNVHLGHALSGEFGTFLSRFSSRQLDDAAVDRASRWQANPPRSLTRFSREDQYLAEGIWHVQRRNQAWIDGDAPSAWRENQILERYFGPVLDTPSYSAPAPSRWSTEHRDEARRRAGGNEGRYNSPANPAPIYVWPRPLALAGLTLVAAAAIALCLYNAGTSGEDPWPPTTSRRNSLTD